MKGFNNSNKVGENLDDIILKRACGFFYTEEVCEYERQKEVKFLLCKNRGRIYFPGGVFLSCRVDEKEGKRVSGEVWLNKMSAFLPQVKFIGKFRIKRKKTEGVEKIF